MFLSPIIDLVFQLFDLLLFARVLLSWINVDPFNPVVKFLYDITEPVLAPIRSRVPPMGGLDLSPIIAIIILLVLRALLRSVPGI
jgi:YggT family protein